MKEVIVSSIRTRMLRTSKKETYEQYTDYINTHLKTASERNSDIIALSEQVFLQYTKEDCFSYDSPILAKFSGFAKKYDTNIILPVGICDNGKLYNEAIVYDRKGKIAGIYRKTHITQLEIKYGFSAGNSLEPIELDFGKIGIVICWDALFEETFRVYSLKGAKIIFSVTHQMGPGRTNYEAMLRGYAVSNVCYIATATVGKEKGQAIAKLGTPDFLPSLVIDPDGSIIASRNEYEGVLTSFIDIDRGSPVYGMSYEKVLNMYDIIKKDRRPELYKEICKPNDTSKHNF